jgi:hypothetical protein
VAIPGCSRTHSSGVLRLAVETRYTPDPLRDSATHLWIDSLRYVGLVQLDSMGVIPGIAVALPTVSHRGTHYVFTLRSGLRFSNGDLVTPRAVAASLARALSASEHSAQAWHSLRDIVGARSLHRGTTKSLEGVLPNRPAAGQVTVVIRRADPSFLANLTLPPAMTVDLAARRDPLGGLPGAGPFAVKSAGNPITLVPNRYYFQGTQTIRQLEVFSMSPGASVAAFNRGKLDAATVPLARFSNSSKRSGFVSTDTTQTFFASLGTQIKPSERAALDESLNRAVLSSPSSPIDPSYALVPPVVTDYPAINDFRPFDPVSAAPVIGSAPRLRVATRGAPPVLIKWLRAQWEHAGAQVTTQPKSGTVGLQAWSFALPSPTRWLSAVGKSVDAPPRYWHLLHRAERVVNEPQEWTYTNLAERLLLRSVRVLPLGVEKAGYLISPKVQGLSPTARGLEPTGEDWSTVTVE